MSSSHTKDQTQAADITRLPAAHMPESVKARKMNAYNRPSSRAQPNSRDGDGWEMEEEERRSEHTFREDDLPLVVEKLKTNTKMLIKNITRQNDIITDQLQTITKQNEKIKALEERMEKLEARLAEQEQDREKEQDGKRVQFADIDVNQEERKEDEALFKKRVLGVVSKELEHIEYVCHIVEAIQTLDAELDEVRKFIRQAFS